MGFVRAPAFFTLRFDGELSGLEIRMRGMSGHGHVAYLEVDSGGLPLSAAAVFIDHVDSWTLQDGDGRSVPVTLDAFMGYDKEFMRAVVQAWIDQVVPAAYPRVTPALPVEEPDLSALADLAQPVPAVTGEE